jgi:hypothetical protein
LPNIFNFEIVRDCISTIFTGHNIIENIKEFLWIAIPSHKASECRQSEQVWWRQEKSGALEYR